MKLLKNLNTYKKLFILLLVCSIVPSIASVIISGVYYMREYKNQLFAVKHEQLNTLHSNYDNYISDTENIALQIINNYQFYSQKSPDTSKLSIIDIQQMMNFNSSILSVKRSVVSIYILPYNTDKMIVNTSFYDIDTFPDMNWKKVAENKSDLLMTRIPYREVTTPLGAIEPCYTLIVPFVESGTTDYSYAVINVSLKRFFNEQLSSSSEKYCIFMEDTLFYTNLNTLEPLDISPKDTGKQIKIEGEKYTFINSLSDNHSLQFASLTKSDNLFSPISSIKLAFLCTLLITLLMAVVFSIIVSQKIYNPIITLFYRLKPKNDAKQEKDTDELAFIERYITDFEEERTRNSHISKKYMLHQLIHNEFDAVSDKITHTFQNKNFVVFTIEHQDYDGLYDTFPKFLERHLSKNLSPEFEFEIFDIDPFNTSVLLFSDINIEIKTDMLSQLFNTLYTSISPHTKSVFIGSGKMVSMKEVHNEFINTFLALKQKIYCTNDEAYIFNYSIDQNLSRGINSYFFDLENKLLSSIKAKDIDRTYNCLGECFSYLKKEKINPDSVVGWLTILRDEIFDIPLTMGYSAAEIFHKDIETLKNNFKYNRTISDYENYFKSISQMTILGITVKTSQKHTLLINDIKEFIKNNLENDTSLNAIASMYRITPQYLSMLFKKDTGETFISYVTREKMEKSKVLLRQTSLSPEEISNAVGYSNTRSFYATFKKHTGMSPIEYRKKPN